VNSLDEELKKKEDAREAILALLKWGNKANCEAKSPHGGLVKILYV
jgi:hypothetical protein